MHSNIIYSTVIQNIDEVDITSYGPNGRKRVNYEKKKPLSSMVITALELFFLKPTAVNQLYLLWKCTLCLVGSLNSMWVTFSGGWKTAAVHLIESGDVRLESFPAIVSPVVNI